MAEFQGVWGIDIGQAGLKAVRLRYAEAAGQVIAVAFDYVPHAKILSQPDAVPHELIGQSLDTFLSRNELKGDLIAVAVPGHTALARFIQLPPVESGKVADIVKYEARQQIPFALEDVIWDFQPIGNPVEESGYILGAEVGLFAMKRDQVMQSLRPFMSRKLEVELVQIAPLGVFNFLCYDQMGLRPGDEEVAQGSYTIALDMGTDNTTLVITNGEKIWIRNVPIGGNHFTRALTKEMKLTFAKAEHLKCNATKSPDPRAVFQALRPVFNDYVSEIQRSIGYFSSVNRDAAINKVVGMGNGFKLAGLQKFLHQNLQYDVERVETFESLVGDTVLSAPLFQENIMSFVAPYGVAIQALRLTQIRTTLLPSEIAIARTIRRKKPWAVVSAAALLMGLSLSTIGYSNVAGSLSTERFGESEQAAGAFNSEVSGFQSAYGQETAAHGKIIESGETLLAPLKQNHYWLELYRAIDECLPRDTGDALDNDDIELRNRINLTDISLKKYDDLSTWFTPLIEQQKNVMLPQDQAAPPSGAGYVVTLVGHHYHHEAKNPQRQKSLYVRGTLLANLSQPELQQPNSPQPVPVRRLGITHVTIIMTNTQEVPYNPVLNQLRASSAMSSSSMSPSPEEAPAPYRPFGTRSPRMRSPRDPREALTSAAPDTKIINRTDFVVQSVWKPIPPEERTQASAEEPAEPSSEAPAETQANGGGEETPAAADPSTPTPE